MAESCCAPAPKRKRNFFSFRAAVILANGLPFLIFWSGAPLALLRDALAEYWRMLAGPLALGFILGGLVDYYVPKEYISKHLALARKRTVFYAAGLGFLMSACSHGILALSMELHKKGASGPATVSFLLASPWANLPVTMLLVGFFGGKGLLIILLALFVAVTTGLGLQQLLKKGWIEVNPNAVPVEEGFSIRKDVVRRIKAYTFSWGGSVRDLRGVGRGILGLSDMVLTWILFGMFLAALSSAFLPDHLFHQYLGPSLVGLLVTLASATVLEVCSEGTSPLAFEIYKHTGAFGNAFAFLMAGVVTDFTEVGLVWKHLGPRTAIGMITLALPQIVLIAWVFNRILL